MKFIHFADAHIGVTTHGKLDADTGLNDRVLDFLDAFDFIIDAAESEHVDFVLFAGDMFHGNRPSPQLISELSTRLAELSGMCPVILIPGNHDQAMNRVSAIQFLEALDLPNIHMSDSPTYYILSEFFIGCIPYPTKNIFNTTQDKLMDVVLDEIDDMLLAAEDYIYRILMYHGTVEGAQFGSYTPATLDNHDTLSIESLLEWDYVALGHIHNHQDLNKGHEPPIVYAGSMERVDFGEALEDKGFVLCTAADGKITYEFITIPVRPMFRLLIDLRGEPIPKHDKIIRKAVKSTSIHPDALVRVIVQADSHDHINHDVIYNELSHVYRVVGIQADVERKDMRRLDIDVPISELPCDVLLEEWLIIQDIGDDDIDEILQIFDGIVEDVDGAR